MPRYIDAEPFDNMSMFIVKGNERPVDVVFRMIHEAPTADVAPVVHGEWCMSTDPLRISQYQWECSNCHSEELYEYNYCPNCGARMDGAK